MWSLGVPQHGRTYISWSLFDLLVIENDQLLIGSMVFDDDDDLRPRYGTSAPKERY